MEDQSFKLEPLAAAHASYEDPPACLSANYPPTREELLFLLSRCRRRGYAVY